MQLPIINIIQNFKLWKELRKAIKEEQLHGGQNEEDAVMRVDSKIQTFRMYQTFGDQIPGRILSWAVTIRQETIDPPINITSIGSFVDIFTVEPMNTALTFLNLCKLFLDAIFVAETFIYMPIFEETNMTKERVFKQTNKSHLFVLPLVLSVFSLRIMNFSIFFGVWRGFNCFIAFSVAIIIYALGFVLLIWMKYKEEWKKNSYPLLHSFFTSIFAPCIVMYPQSKLVFLSSLVSTVPHIILNSMLLIIATEYPDEFSPTICPKAFDWLITWLLIAPIFSWLLQAYSQEKTQKILLSAISFKLLKFFVFTIVIGALDEVTDVLSAEDHFR